MELRELQQLLIDSARHAVQPFVGEIGPSPLLKQAEAHRLFGRGNVERWLAEDSIQKQGKRYSREQLQKVAARLNRVSYRTIRQRHAAAQDKINHE